MTLTISARRPQRSQLLSTITHLLLSVSLALSQSTEPSIENAFCSLSSQALTIHNKKAYITGGWQLWSGSQWSNFTDPSPFMRTIDLSASFFLTDSINTYAPPVALPPLVPRNRQPVFWPSHKTASGATQLELMLGQQQVRKVDLNAGIKPSPWPFSAQVRYDVDSAQWEAERRSTKAIGMTEDVENRMYGSRAQVWVARRKLGFVVVGLETENNVMVNNAVGHQAYGMLIYDGDKKEWRNETGPHGMTENSHLVHLEAGDDDLLITLGAAESTDSGVSEFRLLPMRTIHIYSVQRRKWFKHQIPSTQTAPSKRGAYCTALLPTPDASSYHLYLLLGVSEADTKNSWGDALTDTSVWVLSLPSFTWIQLPATSTSTLADPGGRVSSVCAVAGKGFILVSGGRNVQKSALTPTCDKAGQNVWAFNAEAMRWDHQFNPDLPYGVPSAVSAVIGGNRTGGATLKAPIGGFSDPEMEKLFAFMEKPKSTPASTTDSKTEAPSASAKAASGRSGKSNTIAIAVGAAVGGVGALIIIAVGIWYFRRRKHGDDITRVSPPRRGHHELPISQDAQHGGGWNNVGGYGGGPLNGYADESSGDRTVYGSPTDTVYGADGREVGAGGWYKPAPGEMMAVEEVSRPSEMASYGVAAVEAYGREVPTEAPAAGT